MDVGCERLSAGWEIAERKTGSLSNRKQVMNRRFSTVVAAPTLSAAKPSIKCVHDQWLQDSDLENNHITYATDAWSGVLPAEWIVPA